MTQPITLYTTPLAPDPSDSRAVLAFLLVSVIAFLLHFALCALDLGHCTRLAFTAGGLRCVEVTERPSCEQVKSGWHYVLGTPFCSSGCDNERQRDELR
jgi:hypothetical protein